MVFNSRYTEYKRPFGAVKTGEKVEICFPLDAWITVDTVYFVLRKEGASTYMPMRYSYEKDGARVFTLDLVLDVAGIYYYRFEMHNADGVWFYGTDGYGNAVCGHNLPEWQLTCYNSYYKTPDFVKGGVIYHIFVDRFNRADGVKTKRKYRLHENWCEQPVVVDADGKYRADDFFGGNFRGITEKLGYLSGLGVTVIYLSPVFKSFSNHRYDTGDYLELDELLGTDDDFRELILEAEKRGIAVILDGVFNHSGADSRYFNKLGTYDTVGAYQSKQSPYYKWYYFRRFPDDYACWWGCTNVPDLNKSNPEYRKLLFGEGGVIEKWMSYGVRGWRLDVVDELPVDFTDQLCKKVKSVNPDALIIGEVWEDASTKVSYGTLRPYLLGDQLDGVMNYPFKNAIIEYAYDCEVLKFKAHVMSILENYPKETIDCLMNIVGTHDTVRILNALSGVDLSGKSKVFKSMYYLDEGQRQTAKARLKHAALLQFTLPGVPSVYYGDEVGLEGFEDPINRRPYPWGKEDLEILEHYKRLGQIRRENRALFTSSFEFLQTDGALAYRLYGEDGELIVVSNLTGAPVRINIKGTYECLFKRAHLKDGVAEIDAGDFDILKRR